MTRAAASFRHRPLDAGSSALIGAAGAKVFWFFFAKKNTVASRVSP
jgi:hypothetical protein